MNDRDEIIRDVVSEAMERGCKKSGTRTEVEAVDSIRNKSESVSSRSASEKQKSEEHKFRRKQVGGCSRSFEVVFTE